MMAFSPDTSTNHIFFAKKLTLLTLGVGHKKGWQDN